MNTINFAIVAMMIGSNMMPINAGNIQSTLVSPVPQIAFVSKEAAQVSPPVPEEAIPSETVVTTPIQNKESVAVINQDKTYDECMNEAFERIYEEVNRLLDQIPDRTDEQFQLQRMMK